MPLNSIQQYIANLLNGLAVPGPGKPLEAFITPPTVGKLDGPKAYVWGGTSRARRQTAPRGQGYKHLDWMVDIYLIYETVPTSPNLDQEFPLVVDAVLTKLWSTEMPVFINDPTTGLSSEVVSVGEQWDLDYPPVRTPATNRMLLYEARIRMSVYEAVKA